MVFSSITFLSLFLPIVVLLHVALPSIKAKNVLLTLASLFFYAWGEGLYVLLMLASVLINWLLGLALGKGGSARRSNVITACAVVFNIGMLAVFKYAGFLVELINLLPFVALPVPVVHLPIGISFFTFQSLSYVIDVRRDPSVRQRSFLSVLLYISLFPQLIAGPIIKYHEVGDQISCRRVTIDGMANGIRRFIIGLSKKMLLADMFAVPVDALFAAQSISTLGAWLCALFYVFQIYFDFSGYSDMAIGLGEMFGFHFRENFDYPYISCSIREFWRRWHISLSTWFREYLYIPLGGNRKGQARTCLNLLIVFLATGIWHGANLTFLFWGLFHGILIVLERLNVIRFRHKLPGWIYTSLAVLFGFILFRADSLFHAMRYFGAMFGATTAGMGDILPYLTPLFLTAAVVAVIACLPVVPTIKRRCSGGTLARVLNAVSYPAVFLLFFFCLLLLAENSYSPFIYFRF